MTSWPARFVGISGSKNRELQPGVRALLKKNGAERQRILERIEAAWKHQARRPTAEEVDAWGRPQGPREL
jgi:hypothetical protein